MLRLPRFKQRCLIIRNLDHQVKKGYATATSPLIRQPPSSLPNNQYTKSLLNLYHEKLTSEEIKIFTDKHSQELEVPKLQINQETQLYDYIIDSISKIDNYSRLNELIEQLRPYNSRFPNSGLKLLVEWKRFNDKFRRGKPDFEILGETFRILANEDSADAKYINKLRNIYLNAFRVNKSPLNIMLLNEFWCKHGNQQLENTYVMSHLLNLFNTKQEMMAINTLIDYLDNNSSSKDFLSKLPDKFIHYMLEIQDFERLHFLLTQFARNNVKLEDKMWVLILKVGLDTNNYEIVKHIYKHHIMEGFTGGKITLENTILSQPMSESVYQTFTDSMIFQVLHTISMYGDTESTEDLIKGHFIFKGLAKEDILLSKELGIKIIESHCYCNSTVDGQDDSIKDILELIDVLGKQVELTSSDFYECMNYKFKNWKSTEPDNMKKMEIPEDLEVIPEIHGNPNVSSSKMGVILADLSKLHEFINTHINYIKENNLDRKTTTIFINCVLNHIAIFLNHTGMVAALKNLHYSLGSEFVRYLDDVSWQLIISSLSMSTSKKCARFYYDYMVTQGIEITPVHFAGFIKSSLNGEDFYNDVPFYVSKHLEIHGELSNEVIDSIPLPENVDKQSMIEKVSKDPSLDLNGIRPPFERHYLEQHDLADLTALQNIFR